jgi:hypothetical protein
LILQTAQSALRTDEQLMLFYSDAAIEPIDRGSPQGDYSGERFFARRPEAYKLCVQMLADPSISVRQICRVLHVTDGTVNAVRAREEILTKAARADFDRQTGDRDARGGGAGDGGAAGSERAAGGDGGGDFRG